MEAHEESETLGHRHIGPEHLLLGLFADNASLAAEALRASGITAERIRNLINLGETETIVPEPTLHQNNEVHFLVRGGRAIWSSLYAGGLMLDSSDTISGTKIRSDYTRFTRL